SHELRTPLTVISGYLETLLDHPEALAPRWLRPMQQMRDQAARMSHMLDDLLLLARLEATDYPADNRPVAVERLLQSVHRDALAPTPSCGSGVATASCAAPSPAWCSTRSSTPPTVARCTSAGGATSRARTWRCVTPARASRPGISRVSPSASTGSTPAAPRTPAAPAWGWPSSSMCCCAIADAWTASASRGGAAPSPAIFP